MLELGWGMDDQFVMVSRISEMESSSGAKGKMELGWGVGRILGKEGSGERQAVGLFLSVQCYA